MALMTERLPVGSIPEEFLIPFVRDNMVDIRRRFPADRADRVPDYVRFPRPAPC